MMLLRRHRFCLLLLICGALLLLCTACGREEPVSSTQLLLDTLCTVKVWSPADQELADRAMETVADYESLFSPSLPESEIWKINHSGGESVTICAETAEMLKLALDYCSLSGGRFDITVGRLSELWHFSDGGALPQPDAIAEALTSVNYQALTIGGDADAGYTAQLSEAGAQLDVGAVAKGYIADQLAAFLRGQGADAALIDLGGNILTVGAKPGGGLWQIGIEAPFSDRTEIIGTLHVEEAAVVTSGIYQRQFIEDGQLYHHILDPGTGYPAETDCVSVTVVASSAAAADCLSTVALLLGRDAGGELLAAAEGVYGAVWVDHSGEIYLQGDLDFSRAV